MTLNSLDVLNGGLGICKLIFWKKYNFFLSWKLFSIFIIKPLELDLDTDPHWDKCGSETLVTVCDRKNLITAELSTLTIFNSMVRYISHKHYGCKIDATGRSNCLTQIKRIEKRQIPGGSLDCGTEWWTLSTSPMSNFSQRYASHADSSTHLHTHTL